MSQIGQIISVNPSFYGNDWLVQYQYQLDAGGTQQAQIIAGSTAVPGAFPPYPAIVPFWTSASSTITVSPNPPGTTNPVVLPCPGMIQTSTFGLPLK
jgi:hypothetical protein